MASNAPNLAFVESEASLRYRTPFFSSTATISWDSSLGSFSSSSFSCNEDYPIFSPAAAPLKFKGIPFSWEKIPGIPKHQLGFKKKEYSEHLLLPPPPPPARRSKSSSSKKLVHRDEISPKKSNQKDPFLAALVECSKDGDDDGNHGAMLKGSYKNITRSLSHRFGFMNYASCKRTCAVSEAIVYVRPH